MPLVLEIEHLLGVAFAAQGPDRAAPDWPPQPDRVFSALVAAWATRGEAPAERAALEWLEHQAAPGIACSAHRARPAPLSYVPTNDPGSGLKGNLKVLPASRSRQPRRFPAALPDSPTVHLVWPVADTPCLAELDAIARDVAYVGHSASFTRCRFAIEQEGPATQPARRSIYPGRLKELLTRFDGGRRPPPGQDIVSLQTAPLASPDWLILQLADDRGDADRRARPSERMIDLRGAPVACKAIRDAVMSGYRDAGLDVPEWISGHQADGAPSRDEHLTVVPLAFVAHPHADGGLHGFALIPPTGHDLIDDPAFRAAMRSLLAPAGDAIVLTLGRQGAVWLKPSFEVTMQSLQQARYRETASRWTTVTPLVLDRHLKAGDGPDEMAAIVAASALRATGTPARVVVHKHAAVAGAPSAALSGRAPHWTGWTVPEKLRSRRLVHATLTFEQDVTGPVLLGAGRFYGLGLCLPITKAWR